MMAIEERLMRSDNICISPQKHGCISPENVVVFPQPARCSDPKFKALLTFQEWEQEQLFHNHTITQTMRKNANMVLRCFGIVNTVVSSQSRGVNICDQDAKKRKLRHPCLPQEQSLSPPF